MNEIKEFKILPNHHIWMKFQDKFEKTVDFKPFLGKGFTAELLDSDKFKEVFIEEGGGLAWPNGYDFCPNYLHDFVPAVELSQV